MVVTPSGDAVASATICEHACRCRHRHGQAEVREHDDRGHGHGNEDSNSQDHYHGNGNGTGTTWTVTVRAGDQSALHWKLDSTGPGHDFVVTVDSDASDSRRMAGRVDTGRHSVGDPAMGLADRF